MDFQYTILIIETDRTLGLLYQIEFEELGYRVIVASSDDAAVEKIHTCLPDLVVLDPGMPEVPEENIRASIRHINPVLPIIYHSTFPRADLYNTPGTHCLCKSSDLTELKKIVHNTLQEG